MIEPDQFNTITVAAEATSHEWMGMFIGVPSKQDIVDAIEYHIDKLIDGEVEHEQDEAADYRVALQVVHHSAFRQVSEEVTAAGVTIGHIQCDRLDCFSVESRPLRYA